MRSMRRCHPTVAGVAYTSDESGEREVFVRPFPNVDDGKWQVSTNGGRMAEWGADGRELIYEGRTALMAVAVETEPTFAAGTPEMLFDLTGYLRNDGRAGTSPLTASASYSSRKAQPRARPQPPRRSSSSRTGWTSLTSVCPRPDASTGSRS